MTTLFQFYRSNNLFIAKSLSAILFLFFGYFQTHAAPRPKVKYGGISAADFVPKHYAVDSAAAAVYLFDNGKALFEGNNEGYLSVIYTKHTRVHILNKNGFDAATVSFPIYNYSDNTVDRLKKFEAVTYNLENGKVMETKLERENVFRDKVEKGVTVYKFTFPNIKEGSIIEYRYTIEVPNPGGLRTWNFQGDFPRLWTELDLSIPDIYQYTPLTFGFGKFDYDTIYFKQGSFTIIDKGNSYGQSEAFTINCGVVQHIWGMQNVPALKNEPFIISNHNFRARIEFMYTAFAPDDNTPRPVMKNWFQISEALLKDSDFGLDLDAPNSFLENELNRLKGQDTSQLDIVNRVFRFIRDSFSCPDHDAIYLSQPLKKTFQERKGNVADLNLLLVALYRKLGFQATPVMLSTRENGRPPENYPLLRNFNYILCRLNVSDKYYMLDASITDLGFNKLDPSCYNDNGRMIATTPNIVRLPSDSMLAKKTTVVFFGKNEKGKIGAHFSSILTYDESRVFRKKAATQKPSDMIAEMKKKYITEVDIVNFKIDSLHIYDDPIKIQYDLQLPWEDDVIYFNPVLAEGYKENPFKASERKYPVELGSCFDELYTMNIEIPEEYVVEEMPKSVKLYYDGNKGQFEYLFSKSGNTIYFRMRFKFIAANFDAEDHEPLRNYFADIIKKQSEQIVFKRKK